MQNGRPVRNKDIPILARVLCCMQDARHGEDACAFIEDRLTSITSRLTGMPRGNGGNSGLDEAYAKLEEAGERYAAKLEKALHMLDRAENILNSIENEDARTFAVMRYIYGMSAHEIRGELNMSEWGFKQACRAMERSSRMHSVRWSRRWYAGENTEGSDSPLDSPEIL